MRKTCISLHPFQLRGVRPPCPPPPPPSIRQWGRCVELQKSMKKMLKIWVCFLDGGRRAFNLDYGDATVKFDHVEQAVSSSIRNTTYRRSTHEHL